MRKATLAIVVLLIALTAGCQRLNYKSTFTLKPTEVETRYFDAPAYHQKVQVTIAPTATGVSAYLIKEDDEIAVRMKLQADKEPEASKLLGGRVSRGAPETYSFEATVPSKTKYCLYLKGGSQATDVTVTVVGR